MRWLRVASLVLTGACSRQAPPVPKRAEAPGAPPCDATAAQRALDALDTGEFDIARAATSAAERCSESALRRALSAGWAVEEGRFDDAVKDARAALADDDDDPAVMAEAARALSARGSFDEAIALADRASQVRHDERRFDTLLLAGEIRLDAEMTDAAKATATSLPAADSLSPARALRAGRLWVDLDDTTRGLPYLRRASAGEARLSRAQQADLHHTLGSWHERSGREADKIAEFRRVWDLEHDAAPATPLPPAAFEALVREQVAALSADERRALDRLSVSIADYPAAEIVAEGFDPRSVGLFTGDPDGVDPSARHVPGAIFLYRSNLLATARHPEDLRREIHRTLVHEIGHSRGMTEDDLRAARLP